jgi:phosphatidylinositol alpha-1,6-mannosyltransferase
MQHPLEVAPRVLFIGRSAWSEHGGIQRFNRRVAAGLADFCSVANVLMVTDAPAQMPTDSGSVHYAGFAGSIVQFLAAFVRQAGKSDVLLLGHVNFAPFALLYKTLRPRGKVVLFAHGIEIWNDPRYRRARVYEPWLLRTFVDRVAIVSRYSQGLMAQGFGLSDEQFSLFPNAINIPERPQHVGKKAANILVVSRLASSEAEKHVDKVVRALPKVRYAVPHARITIVGDGGLRPELEALARELGVADYVHFAGFVDERGLAQAYQEACVFALPSSKEGFGIVYLEAWAKGLPVIASRFGAAPEVVADGIDGYTVDPSNSHELAERLTYLLINRDQASRFADAGWQKLKAHYSDQIFRKRLRGICTR